MRSVATHSSWHGWFKPASIPTCLSVRKEDGRKHIFESRILEKFPASNSWHAGSSGLAMRRNTPRGGEDIAFSDFLLPAWKDPQNTTGPFNYINTLKTPFTVDVGGYVVILGSDGSSQQVFSKAMPDWIQELKTHTHRNVKRGVKIDTAPTVSITEVEKVMTLFFCFETVVERCRRYCRK